MLVKEGRLCLRHLPDAPAGAPPAPSALGPVVGELAAGEYYGERSLVAAHQVHKASVLGGGGGPGSARCEVLVLSRHDFQRLAATTLADEWAWACPVGARVVGWW